MDYTTPDLTDGRGYNGLKLSNVTNPHDRVFVQAILSNLRELEALLTAPLLTTPEIRLQKLVAFYAQMNTRNNIRNAVAFGDGEKPDDGVLTARLKTIDRNLRFKVKRVGKVAPFWHEVLQFWDVFKKLIPEKNALLANSAQPLLKPAETNTAPAAYSITRNPEAAF